MIILYKGILMMPVIRKIDNLGLEYSIIVRKNALILEQLDSHLLLVRC